MRQIFSNQDIDLLAYKGALESGWVTKPVENFRDQLREFARTGRQATGPKLPWQKTQNDIRFPDGRLTIWAGKNKSGKSVIVGQVMNQFIRDGQKVLIASLEMKPTETLYRMACQWNGKTATISDCDRFIDETANSLWIYDHVGSVNRMVILNLIPFAKKELGVDHIVIDSLTKCGIGRDDYNGQFLFVDALQWAAKSTGIHIHLIAHMNKVSHSPHDLAGSRDAIRGAGEISDLADAVFVLMRNRAREEAVEFWRSGQKFDSEVIENEWDAYLRLDANRHYGTESTYGLMFDPSSQNYLEERDERVS